MKRIILERLTLRNFKGFREFVLDTNGGNVDAFGDNGTGKTTLFDAFIWCLFGKDSANRTEQLFEIKELDSFGNVLQHKLEHQVEAVTLVDGRRKTFRRVYKEKWTQKRGAAHDTFEGHKTDYYVDGVPVQQKEYKEEVAALIQEDLFKLLTSPTFFNEQLDKKERRKVLLEVCGDITDAEVIHSNVALEQLPSILGDLTIDKRIAYVKNRQKSINTELKELPIRISEANRSMPDVSELDEELLQEDIDTLQAQKKAKEEELVLIHSGGAVAAQEKRLREIESGLLDIKSRLQSESLDKAAHKRHEVSQLQNDFDAIRRQVDDKQRRIKQNEFDIENRNQDASRLRKEWQEENAKVYEGHNHTDNCPTCGQALPFDQLAEAQAKAVAAFNKSKSERIEQISSRGRAASDQLKQLEQANVRLQEEITMLKEQQASKQEVLRTAELELEEIRSGIQDPAADPEYKKLQEEAEKVKQEIVQLRESAKDAYAKVQQEVFSIQADLINLEQDKAKFAQVTKLQRRIAELEGEEKRLAAEYEQLEGELFLMEEFTKTKVSLLESKINSKFRFTRFKLFNEQINGGLEETCVATYNGVPFDGGLNSAARTNVGIDIINALSEHYGFSAPIFIDNAESVTQLLDTDAQVIRLVVSEQDKKLRINPKNNTMQEAI